MNEEYKKLMDIADTASEEYFNKIEKAKNWTKYEDDFDKVDDLYAKALNVTAFGSEEEQDWHFNYTYFLIFKLSKGIKYDEEFKKLKGKSISMKEIAPIYKAITMAIDESISGLDDLIKKYGFSEKYDEERKYYITLKDDAINSVNEALFDIQGITVRKGGCYIATSVYGSYDCEEVWTLRRFRDDYLSKTKFGKLFIAIYYAISPTLVKWFGKRKWFNIFGKWSLNKIVKNLNDKGYNNLPYLD